MAPAARSRTGTVQMFGPGGGGGGFLGVGAPEMVVIGAVAWALLGPKELYKLAKQAGEFLGEWQQLGQQAQRTFKDALESELGAETLEEFQKLQNPLAPRATTSVPREWEQAGGYDVPPLADYAASLDSTNATQSVSQASASPTLQDPELVEQLKQNLGDPEQNRDSFLEQISGERNRQVLANGFGGDVPSELGPYSQFAAEGGAEPAVGGEGVSAVQIADENLIETQISEAENQLAMLRAEAQVLALRRKQQEAAAERMRILEEEEKLANDKPDSKREAAEDLA